MLSVILNSIRMANLWIKARCRTPLILQNVFSQLQCSIHCVSWCFENWILLMKVYCLVKNHFQSIIKLHASYSMGLGRPENCIKSIIVQLIILNLRFCGEWKPSICHRVLVLIQLLKTMGNSYVCWPRKLSLVCYLQNTETKNKCQILMFKIIPLL